MTALPPIMAHALAPARYAVMDIETGDAPAEKINDAIAAWKAPKNWKEATVEAKRAETAAKIAEKAALLDASPILCLSLKTDRMSVIFNGMSNDSFDIPGWVVLPCEDENGLLRTLRALLDASTGPDTVIAGHNLTFDLSKLRNGYLRHRLQLPLALMPGEGMQPTFDTMRQIRYFSMEYADERFIPLETVARALGLPLPKAVIRGSDCPRLHKEGKHQEVLVYNAIDVETTERAYLLMSGQSAELE